ncbi:S1 RNA-binding domain-containing protein [Goodfellowiella coeruleoviolacea]|uniref:Small subunit ribosomal protein S1 n=1 Tax=Goodfellowiella coeruleoviolacea TaxID=334858 RepID=A0AAE3GIZ7_9PSEU|nr:S1 RNA-binding domain-containing protein [Goodfellowiella coeruleoviolacea]MCP2169076.1 small subunit ribosomal protein S1 [Goodfellowiella coeruleoviolacea]
MAQSAQSAQSGRGVSRSAWQSFIGAHGTGGVLTGRVTKVLPFGAFVEVAPGIQGLLPQWSWAARPESGASISVSIDSVDVERRRLSLKSA